MNWKLTVRAYNKPAKIQASKFLGHHALLFFGWRRDSICLSSPCFRVHLRGRGTHSGQGNGCGWGTLCIPSLSVDRQVRGTRCRRSRRATPDGVRHVPANLPRITFPRKPFCNCLANVDSRLNSTRRATISPRLVSGTYFPKRARNSVPYREIRILVCRVCRGP